MTTWFCFVVGITVFCQIVDGEERKCDRDGYFGSSCTLRCKCKDRDEICNKNNGECRECPLGRMLPDCYSSCKRGYYGTCLTKCNCKNLTEVCNKVTGECKTGCPDTYEGVACSRRTDQKNTSALTKLMIIGGCVLAVAVVIGLVVAICNKSRKKAHLRIANTHILGRGASRLSTVDGRKSLVLKPTDFNRASVSTLKQILSTHGGLGRPPSRNASRVNQANAAAAAFNAEREQGGNVVIAETPKEDKPEEENVDKGAKTMDDQLKNKNNDIIDKREKKKKKKDKQYDADNFDGPDRKKSKKIKSKDEGSPGT